MNTYKNAWFTWTIQEKIIFLQLLLSNPFTKLSVLS